MQSSLGVQGTFRFVRPHPPNVLQVVVSRAGVVILAERDNFSVRDQEAFIRYLADEGFIGSHLRTVSANSNGNPVAIEWVTPDLSTNARIDPPKRSEKSNAFMIRLIAGALAAWLIEIAAVVFLKL